MKAGSFILKGINSEDIDTVIQSRPVLETPRRRVEFKQSYGQDGLNPYDEEVYDNTPLSLFLYSNGSNAVYTREIVYDLFNSGDYIDLVMYCDSTKVYKVMTETAPKFESRYYMGEGLSYGVELTVRPYKYLIDSPNKEEVTISDTMFNPTLYSSLPIITIYGSGDITLTVNGIDFVVKGVVDHITLDSELMFAYKEVNGILTSENLKVYTKQYPYLKPAENVISWAGTVNKVEVTPRWRSLT